MTDDERLAELDRRQARALVLLGVTLVVGAALAVLAIGGMLVEGVQRLGAALP